MSVQASAWAWNQSLSGKELIVLLYLSDKAGDNGLSWYGRARIAKQCGMSSRSVSRAMESLEHKGFIKRFKRFTENGDQTSNATVVLFDGRIEDDDLGMMKDENLYSPVNKGLSVLTTPLVSTDNTPLSVLTTKTSVINQRETTTTEKLNFNDFAVCLISILQEMIAEGGWIPEGHPVPKKTWLKAKAQTLHNTFPDPRPEDCALIILKDWMQKTGHNAVPSQESH